MCSDKEYLAFPLARINKNINRQVLEMLRDQQLDDNLLPVEMGFGYSPKAVRLLIDEFCFTVGEANSDESFRVTNQKQFKHNLLYYGYTLGLISKREMWLADHGLPFIKNLSVNEDDQWIKNHPNGLAILMPSLNVLVNDASFASGRKDGKKVVLFHGKWNVPHIGHIAFIANALKTISREKALSMEKLIPVVVCERNKYIKSAGKFPFMNTQWRMSLLSYMPNISYICAAAEISFDEVSSYWLEQYQLLKPDFLPLELGDLTSNLKAVQAAEADIEMVHIKPQYHASRISSTSLLNEGTIANEDFYEEYRAFEKQYGKSLRRKW